MMKCETCSHEYTVIDFVTLRNLCEHLYLDSLAQKPNPCLAPETYPIYRGKAFQSLLPKAIKYPEKRGALLPLEQ